MSQQDGGAVWRLYEDVAPGDTLQQGDLIRFAAGQTPVHYGIVVTGDCDLDNRKHSRLVTLVPLLTVEQIICNCLAYDVLEKKSQELRQFCKEKLLIHEETNDSQFIALVKARVIAKDISEPDVEVVAKATCYGRSDLTLSEVKIIVETAGRQWKKTMEVFENQIKSRGDLLLLCPPPLIEEKPTVAWLRAIWQEQQDAIAIRTSEATERKGLRVAQLRSPFRYRLTQMLGQVFADIGLPKIDTNPLASELRELSC